MKLTLLATERICIMPFLPSEGKMFEMMTAKGIHEKTKLSEEEFKKLTLQQIQNRVEIVGGDFEKEIELENSEISLLKEGFRKLEEASKITLPMITLAEKIRDLTVMK